MHYVCDLSCIRPCSSRTAYFDPDLFQMRQVSAVANQPARRNRAVNRA